jgi:hypothetical protein
MKKNLASLLLALAVVCALPAHAQTNKIDINTQTKAKPVSDTGAADAYVVALSPAATSYVTGMPVVFIAANDNTGASTINVNSLGVKTIKKLQGSSDLAQGDILAGGLVVLIYDGTYFQIQSPVGNASSTSGSNTFGGIPTVPGNGTTFSHLERTAGNPGTWTSCSGTVCAGGSNTGSPAHSFNNASPSLSGTSMSQTSNGNSFNTLYFRHLGCPDGDCTTYNNFLVDLWFYPPTTTTTHVQAFEFDPDLYLAGYGYFASVQCDYASGKWRLYDTNGHAWVTTTYTCTLATNTWHHLQLYVTLDNVAHTYTYMTFYVDDASIFTNLGTTYSAKNGGYALQSLNIEQQIDNDSSATATTAYYDNYFFSVWHGSPFYGTIGGGGSGVTSVATTTPITGGPITGTGTIACPTCVTSASSLTSGQLVAGAGSQASQVTNLTGDATTSGGVAVTVAKINGTSVPVNSAADQTLVTTASATGAWKSLVDCANDGGHAEVYSTSTHSYSCATISASGVSGGFAWGGDGSDGSVTADGSTTLTCLGAPSSSIYTMTRDCSFAGLTVNNGVTVLTSNFALYVQGTLTVNSGGTINNNGSTGNVGQNAGSSTGGTGGSLTNAAGSGTPSHYLRLTQSKAGTAGGNGGTTTGTQAGAANAGNNTSNAVDSSGVSGSSGNNGGVGGTGTSGAGGAARSGAAGGTVTSVAEVTGHNANAAYWGSYLNSGVPAGLKQYGTLSAGNGGAPGGSGGGGDTTNAGGGGGGGGGEGGYGGILAIFAATISNSGTISANGGTGGVGGNGRTQTLGNVGGGGGGAGGSGGNGGIVWLVYKSLTNSGTISASGGSGGNGGTKGSPHGTGTDNAANGDNGPTGKAGIVIQIQN